MAGEPPPSDNVYVTGLPAETDEDVLRAIFSQFGTIQQCKVLPAKSMVGTVAGLVRFSSVQEASSVIDTVNGSVIEGLTEPLMLRFADPPGSKYGKASSKGGADRWSPYPAAAAGGWGGGAAATKETAPPSDNLYVTGLPPGMTEEMLLEIFQEYGQVVQARVLQSMPGSKCAALVRFESVQVASAVKETANGTVPLGLSEPIRVVFADPPGTSKQGGSGYGKGGQQPATAFLALPAQLSRPAGVAALASPRILPGLAGRAGQGVVVSPRGAASPVASPRIATPNGLLQFAEKAPQQLATAAGLAAAAEQTSIEVVVAGFENTGALPGGTGDRTNGLYVAGLPADTKDVHLFRLFAPFGAISVKGVRAMCNPDGTCKGYGFVNFLESESAENAITAYNGAVLPDGTVLKVRKQN